MHFFTRPKLSTLFVAFLLVTSCAKNDPADPDNQPGDQTPFSEGTIEMGMYSHGVDLGLFIREIDFSRGDAAAQFRELVETNEEAQQFMQRLQEYSVSNPFAAMGLMLNGVICTYYVKGDAVLGKARGFGFELDNYHDAGNDEGKLFMRTLVQTDDIPGPDRAVSVHYVPSEDLGVGSGGSIDASMYERSPASEKAVVAGYSCRVATYTLKPEYIPESDPESPLPPSPVCYKLVVYTSDAFHKTINFTHPFYLPEDAGILKLEIFYDNGAEPTLVMQPDDITPRVVTDAEMQVRVTDPVYEYGSTDVAWKMFAILFSGWGALDSGK